MPYILGILGRGCGCSPAPETNPKHQTYSFNS